MNADWDGQPGSLRYEQVTAQMGSKGTISLNDEDLIYIRLNPRTHTPFGLGRLEVAFETINAFLGAHRYAARLASNSVVRVCAVAAGFDAGASRAADPVVAG